MKNKYGYQTENMGDSTLITHKDVDGTYMHMCVQFEVSKKSTSKAIRINVKDQILAAVCNSCIIGLYSMYALTVLLCTAVLGMNLQGLSRGKVSQV